MENVGSALRRSWCKARRERGKASLALSVVAESHSAYWTAGESALLFTPSADEKIGTQQPLGLVWSSMVVLSQ